MFTCTSDHQRRKTTSSPKCPAKKKRLNSVHVLANKTETNGHNRGEAAMWDTQKHRGMDEMMVGERWLGDGRRRRRRER